MKSITVGLLSVTLLLAGCTGMRIVDTDVRAFATASAQATPSLPLRYRFDRLPSQISQPAQSAALEILLQPELEKAGLLRDEAAPAYTVQIALRMFRDPQAPWDDPRYIEGYAGGRPILGRYGLLTHYPPLTLQFEFPYYRRELSVVVRRVSDAQAVFESRAQHDGRWADDEAVLPAMMNAALRGFPAPPPGLRRIVVEIPR